MTNPICTDCHREIHEDASGHWDAEIGWLCGWCFRAEVSVPMDDRTHDDDAPRAQEDR